MVQTHRPIMTHRKLFLFKWLMILLPVTAVTLGHSLVQHAGGGTHGGGATYDLSMTLLVGFVGVALTYIFVETLYRVLGRLQAEIAAQEQDIRTMNAVMQERERLSRELHDGAAQLVADLLLRLDTIQELVEADRKHEAGLELERLHGVANEIYQDIGESITGLRNNVTERGLVLALQDYVDQFEERYQTSIHLHTDDAVDQLSSLAALQLFRFIQEGLTNVRKHAEAQEATVTLTANGLNEIKVIIADDGQGFNLRSQSDGKTGSLGLTSMRERIESLGGTFDVHSRPGSGTQVTATIPISQPRKENGHAAVATLTR
ncbi:MAG TPA: sensor histidine kinase [Anaerolineae bacterium]|nr:sensor histidine kinase [Anaerolineae bacterium]